MSPPKSELWGIVNRYYFLIDRQIWFQRLNRLKKEEIRMDLASWLKEVGDLIVIHTIPAERKSQNVQFRGRQPDTRQRAQSALERNV
jgi:CRISPR/Cas system CMR subunit Cmr6 (Cas7 group RAMP superfamily)